MKKLTKYQSKVRRMVVKVMSATCLACLLYVPMSMRNESEAVGSYKVIMNGQELGSVNSPEDAKTAYNNARKDLILNNTEVVYANPGFEIVEEDTFFGTRLSVADMQAAMYNNLSSNLVALESQEAYTVRINDFTVTLGSKEEVLELIERTKAPYDANNEFQVAIVTDDNGQSLSIELSKSGFAGKDDNLVALSPSGNNNVSVESEKNDGLGISSIDFCQNIEIVATKATTSNILSVDEAFAQVSKTTEEKTYYTVVAGDCVSLIARKNGLELEQFLSLNPGLAVDSLIYPGDQLIVTVPTPELSVEVVERVTFEETYNAPVQYVQNASMYRGTSKVINDGSAGVRTVVADVVYVDGVESSRTIVTESITKAAVAQVVQVGTLVPPTYIKPVSSTTITYTFGYHGSHFHKGNDWYCPVGTPIRACAAGTVIRASWYNGYGNCIDIRHANGVVTRYAHLSGYNVRVGQQVGQGATIGYSGATGNVTGPHIHLEFIVNGTLVDPLKYVSR